MKCLLNKSRESNTALRSNNNKEFKHTKRYTVMLSTGIVVVLGVLILFAYILFSVKNGIEDSYGFIENIIVSIICSMIASFLFMLLQSAIEEDKKDILLNIDRHLRVQKNLYDSGIVSIRKKSYYDGKDDFWENIIRRTDNRLDLIGHAISNWFEDEYKDVFLNKIKEMINSDKDVRIILSGEQPDWSKIYMVQKGLVPKKTLTKLERTCYEFKLFLDDIPSENHKKNLHLYISDLINVTYLYIRTDSQCLISPYIQSTTASSNTFLLELELGTEYVKCFENDFNDMIELSEEIKFKTIFLKKKIEIENDYSGSDWNHEVTAKYIFYVRGSICEVGFFKHYKDNILVKNVIELPQTIGCPAKCKYCASSSIREYRKLESDEIIEIFDYIYMKNNLIDQPYVLVTMTGIGDLHFNMNNVLKFFDYAKKYLNVYFTVSSCLWNKKMITKIDNQSPDIKIRYIQITYITDNIKKLKEVIPYYENNIFELNNIINAISKSNNNFYRFNYLVLKNINDHEEDFDRFIALVSPIKNKIIVRISMLNMTKAAKINKISPADFKMVELFKDKLDGNGIKCYIFYSQKDDHMNCGQLITENKGDVII